jgi:RNA polymerase sigma-70 factor, ECF subfamily
VSTLHTATVRVVDAPTPAPTLAPVRPGLDPDSAGWLNGLRAHGAAREETVARLHALLLRAARFEVQRRRVLLPFLRGNDLDDLAFQAADDALVSVLAHLDDFRGASRFTTWAYKFALLEAAVKLRKRAWQDREVPLAPEAWSLVSSATSPTLEHRELLGAVQAVIGHELTPHQRDVLVALALNEVPIDVLAERLGTTRGALYKTLHDARRKLRATLERDGFELDGWKETAR